MAPGEAHAVSGESGGSSAGAAPQRPLTVAGVLTSFVAYDWPEDAGEEVDESDAAVVGGEAEETGGTARLSCLAMHCLHGLMRALSRCGWVGTDLGRNW